jgi:hypothetical protein
MTHDETHETLFDNTIRFERVIYMAGALAQAYSLPDDLRDFFGDEDDKTIRECFPGFPQILTGDEDDDVHIEFAAEWLIDNYRMGYLVQVATPVMKHHKKSGASYSWGYYSTQWVYGHTMSEVVYKAVQWAKGQRESEKEKAK